MFRPVPCFDLAKERGRRGQSQLLERPAQRAVQHQKPKPKYCETGEGLRLQLFAEHNGSEEDRYGRDQECDEQHVGTARCRKNPVEKQVSRSSKLPVFRIFALHSLEEVSAPNFNEVEEKIKNSLLDKAIAEETDSYLKELRTFYGIENEEIKSLAQLNPPPYYLN